MSGGGNGVSHGARRDAAEFESGSRVDFGFEAREHPVGFNNKARHGEKRIRTVLGLRNVRALPRKVDRDFVRLREKRTGKRRHDAHREVRPEMEPVNCGRVLFLKDPRFADESCAAGGFLSRLKDDENVLRELRFETCYNLSEPERYRHVAVVTAGMHFPGMRGFEV